MLAALSEEDDKHRARLEIVRSYLYGERAYVALLNSLVQVSHYLLVTPLTLDSHYKGYGILCSTSQ